MWLILAKERLHPIPEYNENLAYILEDEDFVMDRGSGGGGDLEKEEGKFETEGDVEKEEGKSEIAQDSDLELPLRELGKLKEKAKNVTEALRALDTEGAINKVARWR